MFWVPAKAKKPCSVPACPNLTNERYCANHSDRGKQQDRQRGTSAERGYGSAWRKARAGWLRKHPLCAECKRKDIITEATEVDHILPHKGNRILFWDRANWQSLCKSCHSAKTALEDGGFGRSSKTSLLM